MRIEFDENDQRLAKLSQEELIKIQNDVEFQMLTLNAYVGMFEGDIDAFIQLFKLLRILQHINIISSMKSIENLSGHIKILEKLKEKENAQTPDSS